MQKVQGQLESGFADLSGSKYTLHTQQGRDVTYGTRGSKPQPEAN
jgi:hypothetical protein